MLDETLAGALQSQFNRERENQAFYQAVADALDNAYWPGFSAWFRGQAEDEQGHARRLADYLIDQGRTPQYAPLPAPGFQDGEPLSLFTQALVLERRTTEEIDQLYHLAEMQEHPATCAFLLWFATEQVEEERTITDKIQALTRADCSAAVLLLDREHLTK